MTDLTKLSEYDFYFGGDASGSMGEPMPNGRSRWVHMQESVLSFVRDIEQFDSDGIDVVFFGGGVQSFQGVTSQKVSEVFSTRSPRGGTPLAEALSQLFAMAGKSDKKDFILVATDGEPDDKEAVKRVIIEHANKQETDDACTVLFVQIGNEPRATAFLKSLDDELKGAKFDIVDYKTQEEAEAFPTMAALVMAAIND